MSRKSRRRSANRNSKRSRRSRSRRSRNSKRSSRSRSRNKNKRQRGGNAFGAILKEAIVPIAFLGTNIKLKKKKFGHKKVMIPIFKNMNQAKLDRDRGRTKRRKLRKRLTKRRRR